MNIKIIVWTCMLLIVSSFVFAATPPNYYSEAFNFNNATGSLTNRTGINGTLLAEVGTPTLTAGKIQNGTAFSGTSQALTSSLTKYTDLTNASKTIALWVKPSGTKSGTTCSLTNTGGLVTLGKNSVYRQSWSLCQMSFGYEVNREIPGVNFYQLKAYVSVDTSAWHHVAYTYDNVTRNVSIYYDGVLKNSTTYVWPPDTPSGTLEDGLVIGRSTTSAYFAGSLDNVLIYGANLSATDISDIYNLGNGQEPPYIAPLSFIYLSSMLPYNMSYTLFNYNVFSVNVTNVSGTFNLTLRHNDTTYANNNTVSSSGVYYLYGTNVPQGKEYLWWINATDTANTSRTNISEKRNIYYVGNSTTTGTNTRVCLFPAGSIALNSATGCV